MGVTKTILFSEVQNELALNAKLFAHPARVAIIQYLVAQDTCINGDLVKELGLAQATISQHLRELKSSGLIDGNIEGVSVSYCINRKRWEEIKTSFMQVFNQIDCSKSCC